MIEASVIFPGVHSTDEFKDFVVRHGGHWAELSPGYGPGYGVVQKGDAAIYVTLIPGFEIEMCEDKHLATFRRTLGQDPRSRVAIEIAHSAGSQQLADEFVARITSEWEGVADWSQAR
jgi:hypothetical protein